MTSGFLSRDSWRGRSQLVSEVRMVRKFWFGVSRHDRGGILSLSFSLNLAFICKHSRWRTREIRRYCCFCCCYCHTTAWSWLTGISNKWNCKHHCNAYREKFYWELSSHILPCMRGTVSQPLSVFLSRAAIFFSCYMFDRDWWWVFWLVVNTASASYSVHLFLTVSETTEAEAE